MRKLLVNDSSHDTKFSKLFSELGYALLGILLNCCSVTSFWRHYPSFIKRSTLDLVLFIALFSLLCSVSFYDVPWNLRQSKPRTRCVPSCARIPTVFLGRDPAWRFTLVYFFTCSNIQNQSAIKRQHQRWSFCTLFSVNWKLYFKQILSSAMALCSCKQLSLQLLDPRNQHYSDKGRFCVIMFIPSMHSMSQHNWSNRITQPRHGTFYTTVLVSYFRPLRSSFHRVQIIAQKSGTLDYLSRKNVLYNVSFIP